MRAILGLLGLAGAAAAWTLGWEPRWLRLRQVEVPVKGLPAEWDGVRIGLLSDLHTGRWAPAEHYERAVEMLKGVDLALLAGDVADARAPQGSWQGLLEPLGWLDPPRGRFAVLGGHDHRNDAEAVQRRLEGLGWRVLRNQKVDLGGLWLVGLDDNSDPPYQGDLAAACNGLPPGAPAVLMAHSPDAVAEARQRGLSLVVSGHTHGGQVRLPFKGALVSVTDLDRRYDSGLSRHGDTWLYVSRGVASSWRLRFLCRPGVSILTLRRS